MLTASSCQSNGQKRRRTFQTGVRESFCRAFDSLSNASSPAPKAASGLPLSDDHDASVASIEHHVQHHSVFSGQLTVSVDSA
jgi:hypothetical protein